MFGFLARENMALSLSALAAGLFAVAGIVWGLRVDSLVILFDGAYSLVSLGLSLLSLYAARLVRRPANTQFPFGRGAAEPLVIAIKGLVIAAVCLVSLGSALSSLAEGGRDVQAGRALVFGVISVLGCLVVWRYLARVHGHRGSGLVEAEYRQWFMDMILSAAVVVGFAVAWMLDHHGYGALARYADPLMMVLISAYFIQVPVRMIQSGVRELMLAAPPEEVLEGVHEVLEQAGIQAQRVRVAKVGPNLMLAVSGSALSGERRQRICRTLSRRLSDWSLQPFIYSSDPARGLTDKVSVSHRAGG